MTDIEFQTSKYPCPYCWEKNKIFQPNSPKHWKCSRCHSEWNEKIHEYYNIEYELEIFAKNDKVLSEEKIENLFLAFLDFYFSHEKAKQNLIPLVTPFPHDVARDWLQIIFQDFKETLKSTQKSF